MNEQPIDTIAAAVQVLNQTRHRGARDWHFDPEQQRIMPSAWGEGEYPPIFTPFEALTSARGLTEIHARRVGKIKHPRTVGGDLLSTSANSVYNTAHRLAIP